MDNSKRNFLITNKSIGVLEIKIDQLENKVSNLEEKVSSMEDHLSKIETDVANVKNEISDFTKQSIKPGTNRENNLNTEIKTLNQKLDILQGITAIILLGIIVNIFSEPLLTAFSP